MKTVLEVSTLLVLLSATGGVVAMAQQDSARAVALPAPRRASRTSLEAALLARRSIREFTRENLTLADVSQLLWAAQGITASDGGRTAPSAGALYPLESYLVAGRVRDLPEGMYRYRPRTHDLREVGTGDRRRELARAALNQGWVNDAAAVIVFTAVPERTTQKYGQRGVRYVHMEVGHAAQNIYLQAAALDLGTVFVGAFDDARVSRVLGLPGSEQPLGLMPVGRPR